MIITFDFDRTLSFHSVFSYFGNGSLIPFGKTLEKFAEFQEAGHSVNILTTRMDIDMPAVNIFLEEYNLEPDNVWNTNFKKKAVFAKKLFLEKNILIDHHFDDDPTEFKFFNDDITFANMEQTLVYSNIGRFRFIDMKNQTDDDKRDIWRMIRG